MSSNYTRGETVVVTSVAAFAALLVGVAAGSGSFDEIKGWQTTYGALFTLAAVIVAVWNVGRQLRMTLITREEALMEDRQPGLQQAVTFIMFLNLKLEDEDIYKKLPELLQEYHARGDREVVTAVIEKRLPLTDIATKLSLLHEFNLLNFAAGLMEEGSDLNRMRFGSMMSDDDEEPDEIVVENAAGMVAQGRGYVDEARANLRRIELKLRRRLELWDERLPRFRAEIEKYFER